ncbi:sulfite exporter TauE/SafE family protein [Psychrobacter sp. FDAARGOS_221]|uniref:sulfite exporter TauE/SafE family protein n=1 Tax=Psychrobacter sp. FDAARGOS_221 TaxID=1975705 RepID=UPI000BB53D3D|nr:sulfite exporter TauE/SafE family protein [Psychrobacter sp. FDAARGOS_221]PNK61543.1 sulfite exporter TauE/SafE family protein [Psychrobacter sp. FDAARGOS_221]
MNTALLVAGFAMGFFGSPHCLGMCGGLVTAFGLSMQNLSAAKKRALVATYHFGRLLSYSLLGIVAGIIGTSVLAPIMVGNSLPRILLGAVLIFIGLNMLGLPFLAKLEKVGMGMWKKLSPLRQKVFPITTFPRALAAGLLWGFLPCGLVYGALLMAAVGNDVVSAAMIMFAFGLGTVPMLVATQETVGWLHKQIGRFRLRQLNGIIMMLSGLAVIFLPLAMKHSGGHGAHGGHAEHAAHTTHSQQHMTSDTVMNENSMNQHNMNEHTNHTMPASDMAEMEMSEHQHHPAPASQ